jgi:HD-GYP domain-containing protein (c-di-GMP phosphodiesterase class II)
MDAKSPVGYGHITRVGKMMELFSEAINQDQKQYKNVQYNRDELLQLKLAAWMHDIGKISTPEPILNKSTKLETTYNRIGEISARFQSVILSLKLALAEKEIAQLNGARKFNMKEEIEKTTQEISQLEDDLFFIKQKNLPSGLMDDDDIQRIENIAKKEYFVEGRKIHLLTPDEVKNLSIRYGTLNEEERAKINEHAKISNQMLDMLVFPKKFKEVPKIAGMHHEKLNGEGYPNGVKGDDIPFEARLLAIIDIFEALTAHDRPYKRPKTLSETYTILDNMVKEGALDGEIIKYLKESGLFEKYAKAYLLPEQLQ